MKTRHDVLSEAVEEALKECYKLAQPKVTWEDFKKENKEYIDNKLDEKGIPAPYNFYYLPVSEFEYIKDYVADSYRLYNPLVASLERLVGYFKNPRITVYDKQHGKHYEALDDLESVIGEEAYEKVMDYIEKCSDFYKADSWYNSYCFNVCLGASPSSNKEEVIKNWKKYRNKDITIDDSLYEENSDED